MYVKAIHSWGLVEKENCLGLFLLCSKDAHRIVVYSETVVCVKRFTAVAGGLFCYGGLDLSKCHQAWGNRVEIYCVSAVRHIWLTDRQVGEVCQQAFKAVTKTYAVTDNVTNRPGKRVSWPGWCSGWVTSANELATIGALESSCSSVWAHMLAFIPLHSCHTMLCWRILH